MERRKVISTSTKKREMSHGIHKLAKTEMVIYTDSAKKNKKGKMTYISQTRHEKIE